MGREGEEKGEEKTYTVIPIFLYKGTKVSILFVYNPCKFRTSKCKGKATFVWLKK